MRAKLFINFPVLSFREQMQIDVSHDRTVLVSIPCELLRAVHFKDAQMVRNVRLRGGDSGAKETFRIEPFRSDWIVRFAVEHYLDHTRIRAKGSDLQVIADFVRTQHLEGIGVKTADKFVNLVAWDGSNFESFH